MSAGLTGRIGAAWARPEEYADWTPFRRYFEARLLAVSIRSGIRTGVNARITDETLPLVGESPPIA